MEEELDIEDVVFEEDATEEIDDEITIAPQNHLEEENYEIGDKNI